MTRGSQRAFSVDDFVESLTAQLDRAQDALAMKARSGRPLTFALRDLSVKLQVFFESDTNGRLRVRHAGPNEAGATELAFGFTTITRDMVEENTLSMDLDHDPRQIDQLGGGDGLDDADRDKLQRTGVRTVGQFKRLLENTDPVAVEAYLGIPMLRLQAALRRSSEPVVTGHEVVTRSDGRPLLRIRGANLAGAGQPEVALDGEPVEVLDARPNQLLVRPLSHHAEGQVAVRIGGRHTSGFYEIPGRIVPTTGEAK